MNSRKLIPIAALTVIALFGLLLVFLILQGLRSISEISSPEPTMVVKTRTSSPVSSVEVSSKSSWLELQLRTPQPHSRPLPDSASTFIDGTYAKFDPSWPQWWMCRRCADYRPAGGIWKLRFDRGVMRIHYNVTEWVSLASYEVSGNRLFIFNDPYCPEEVGEYLWALEDKWGLPARSLILEVISDPCSFGLRAENLSAQTWGSCLPPNEMTGASDHWRKPPGCEDPDPILLNMPVEAHPSLIVDVHQGYARDFAVQPEVYADANRDESAPPEGIEILHDDSSIPYGLNRVLWGEGSWVETSTELPFEGIGVQILGDNTIGWARLLFDGQEFWRGDTREIWMDNGRYGGYIEVSGFEPGRHTLRIESLGVDYHPVVVAFFGFSLEQGAKVADR